MKTLLIKNAQNIITMDEERNQYPGGSIYIEDQEIQAIGTDIPYKTADEVINAEGKII